MSEHEYTAGGSRSGNGRPAEPERARRGRSGGGGGASGPDPEAWMVTFSDLLTLLMTFFVLIFASSDPMPPDRVQEVFGQSPGVFGLFRSSFLERINVVTRRDISEDLLQVFLDEIGALEVEVEQTERGLIVTLPSDTYFEPGGAELNEQARERLDRLAEFLVDTRHNIRVEGHTDDREQPQPPYEDRYDLSLARAHAAQERLLAAGVAARRLALMGYGPSRPRFNNVSRLGRAQNRRVDIVILNRGGETR